MPARNVKVAIVQMEVVQGNPMANLAKMERFIALAAGKGAGVVAFPEYSVTGSVRGKPHLIDSRGAYRKLFSALAKRNSIDIIPGTFIESSGGKSYNASCYFDRSGKLLGLYRKVNLWHTERERLSRGSSVSVFKTRFGKAGLAICWDLSDPMLFRRMAGLGARIIYVPSFWSDGGNSSRAIESRNLDSLCHARAFETESAVILVNAAGKFRPGDSLIGRSQAALPIKGAVKRLSGNRESMAVIDIRLDVLSRAAKVYKIRKDIRSGYNK